MIKFSGTVKPGIGDFGPRMSEHQAAFTAVTGERLFPGTLNVHLEIPVPPREHFRLSGASIGHPHEDFLFEVIRIAAYWAYRIRPLNLSTGAGGHGDHVVEVASATYLPPEIALPESRVEITFFRNYYRPVGP